MTNQSPADLRAQAMMARAFAKSLSHANDPAVPRLLALASDLDDEANHLDGVSPDGSQGDARAARKKT